DDAAGVPDQPQITGRQRSDRFLKRRRGCQTLERRHRRSARRPPRALGVVQAVQVDDEVAHMRVVDGLLRLGLPGDIGTGVIRVDADDVDLVEIAELVAAEFGEFAAEDQMQQLRLFRTWLNPSQNTPAAAAMVDSSGRQVNYANSAMRSRTSAKSAAWRSRPA